MAIPEHLATWYVDDWLNDREPRMPYEPASGPGRQMFLQLLSRRRFRDARAAWATEQRSAGRPVPEFKRIGNPKYRNPPSQEP